MGEHTSQVVFSHVPAFQAYGDHLWLLTTSPVFTWLLFMQMMYLGKKIQFSCKNNNLPKAKQNACPFNAFHANKWFLFISCFGLFVLPPTNIDKHWLSIMAKWLSPYNLQRHNLGVKEGVSFLLVLYLLFYMLSLGFEKQLCSHFYK